ncbi:MAG: hypothetical protein LKM30_02125 [Bacilli bacterium]|jgi:hypothetical protein|nr:hypothetical protein [Bacilli bacterium]
MDPKSSKETIPKEVFCTLTDYLKKQNINALLYLHLSKSQYDAIRSGHQVGGLYLIYKMKKSFSGFSYAKARTGKEALPLNEKDYGFQRKTEKIRYLDKYLTEKYQISLA